VWGRVQRIRNVSEDDWKDVRAREKVETRVRGSIDGMLDGVEYFTLITF
jgi:hypothetical protein